MSALPSRLREAVIYGWRQVSFAKAPMYPKMQTAHSTGSGGCVALEKFGWKWTYLVGEL